jgi:hypothetical protein
MNEELLQRLEREAEKITLDMPASLDDTEFTKVFNLEFARLIVAECIDTVLDSSVEYTTRPRIAHELSQHFGLVNDSKLPNPPTNYGTFNQGVMSERNRIVNLLMIQHELAKDRHNYWKVAAELIQADVASNT